MWQIQNILNIWLNLLWNWCIVQEAFRFPILINLCVTIFKLLSPLVQAFVMTIVNTNFCDTSPSLSLSQGGIIIFTSCQPRFLNKYFTWNSGIKTYTSNTFLYTLYNNLVILIVTFIKCKCKKQTKHIFLEY